MKILIIDDHPVVREGLEAMISSEGDIEVVGHAQSGKEGIEAFSRLRPDVVLLDLLLPDKHGVDVIRGICAVLPSANIIVLTSAAGDEEIHKALEVGARGYLFKDMARMQLVHAIRAVHAGRRFIPPEVGARLAEGLPRPALSARELEVLELVAVGKKNKEIAYQLNVSESTINAHVKQVLQKLDAADRTEAVTIALRRGFIRL